MTLYDHQRAALERTKDFTSCAYYHDMGLGKTYTGAEKLISLNNRVNLIVCQKSKVEDWVKHFWKNYPAKYIVCDLTKKDLFGAFMVNVKYHENAIVVGIINYELTFRRSELLKLRNVALMLDESQYIQNEKTKCYKFISKLDISHCIMLSGTPTGGKYEKLWTQCHLLGWKISKKAFWDRYIEYRPWQPAPTVHPIKIVTGYKNVDNLKENLRKHGADFLKTEDVLSLPEQVFTDVYCGVSPAYKRFCKSNIVSIEDKELVGDTTLTKLLYRRQLCGIYAEDKLKKCADLIDSTDNRVIVFYNFTEELARLKAVIGERPCSVVNGQIKDLSAYESEENAVVFVQYQAGSMGLNLQKATHIIYYTLPLSSMHFEQSKKRIHRIGQANTCFYYTLICKGSVEEKIFETLKKRKDYTEKLFELDRLFGG